MILLIISWNHTVLCFSKAITNHWINIVLRDRQLGGIWFLLTRGSHFHPKNTAQYDFTKLSKESLSFQANNQRTMEQLEEKVRNFLYSKARFVKSSFDFTKFLFKITKWKLIFLTFCDYQSINKLDYLCFLVLKSCRNTSFQTFSFWIFYVVFLKFTSWELF